jgi:predicted transcriptional regulator of viral defense system
MPIDIDRFEQADKESLQGRSEPTNAEIILQFLASNPEQAYTPKEIHEATEVTRNSVGVVLSRLENRGLVRHRGEYWAIAEGEDIEQTLDAFRVSRSATDRLGEEDPDEWGPGVEEE